CIGSFDGPRDLAPREERPHREAETDEEQRREEEVAHSAPSACGRSSASSRATRSRSTASSPADGGATLGAPGRIRPTATTSPAASATMGTSQMRPVHDDAGGESSTQSPY